MTAQGPRAKSNAPCPQWPRLGRSSAPGPSPREEMAVSLCCHCDAGIRVPGGHKAGLLREPGYCWAGAGRAALSPCRVPAVLGKGPTAGQGGLCSQSPSHPVGSEQSCRHAGRRGAELPPSALEAPGTGFCRGARAQGAAAVSGRWVGSAEFRGRWLSFEGSS